MYTVLKDEERLVEGYYDERGNAFRLVNARPCFICNELTERLDICFEGPFCDSPDCWEVIGRELKAASDEFGPIEDWDAIEQD